MRVKLVDAATKTAASMFRGITKCCHIRREGSFLRNVGEHRKEYTASQTGHSLHYSHLRSLELPKVPSKHSTSGLYSKRKNLPIFDTSAGRQYIHPSTYRATAPSGPWPPS
jgi:hypothetical protein